MALIKINELEVTSLQDKINMFPIDDHFEQFITFEEVKRDNKLVRRMENRQTKAIFRKEMQLIKIRKRKEAEEQREKEKELQI